MTQNIQESKARALELAQALACEADSLKGENIEILDVSDLLYVTDYFVMVTTRSARQTKALGESLKTTAKADIGNRGAIEGSARSEWMLCDFDDVVVHILTESAREFYDLDTLWADAPRMETGLPEAPTTEEPATTELAEESVIDAEPPAGDGDSHSA